MVFRFFKSKPMSSKIFIALLLMLIFPFLVLGSYIYFSKVSTIKTEFQRQLYEDLSKCSNFINSELMLNIEKSTNAISNPYILNGLKQNYVDNISSFINFENYLNAFFIGVNREYSTNAETIKIYLKNKTSYRSRYIDHIENMDKTPEALEAANSILSEIKWDGNVVRNRIDEEQYLVYYRSITEVVDNIGVLRVMIPYKKIEYYMKNSGIISGGTFAYYDKSNKIVSSVGDNIDDIKKGGIYLSQKLVSGHTLVAYLPQHIVNKEYLETFTYLGLGFMMVVLLTIVFGYYISNSITFRLHSFIENLRNSKQSNLQTLDLNETDEISIIEKKFERLIKDIENMHSETNLLRAKIDTAEIELLQAKINPHLLYNSLSSIRWEASRKGAENICSLIDILTKYYRGIFSRDDSVVTVKDEMKIIEDYIEITKLSYKMNYDVNIEIMPETANCYMYKMLLQPLVENAILHGIHGYKDGRILIKSYLDGHDIVFKIEDNGYGIKPEKLKELTDNSNNKHYGIRNIKERIKLFYGESYGVEIDSVLNEGTFVTVRIPCESKEKLLEKLSIG